ncbi:hypothetical protein D3C71_1755500 [compost metagenome]
MGGIDDQVHEHLIELRAETLHRLQLAVVLDHLGLELDLVPDHVERAVEALVQIGLLPVARVDMGEVAQILDDLLDPLQALA